MGSCNSSQYHLHMLEDDGRIDVGTVVADGLLTCTVHGYTRVPILEKVPDGSWKCVVNDMIPPKHVL